MTILFLGVDDGRRLMAAVISAVDPDGDDPVLLDGDRAVLDDAAVRIHRDDDAVGDDDIGHSKFSGLGVRRSAGLAADVVEASARATAIPAYRDAAAR